MSPPRLRNTMAPLGRLLFLILVGGVVPAAAQDVLPGSPAEPVEALDALVETDVPAGAVPAAQDAVAASPATPAEGSEPFVEVSVPARPPAARDAVPASFTEPADAFEAVFGADVPAAEAPAPTPARRARTGYGLSRALGIVLVPVQTPLSSAWLEPFGTGWSSGHRWRAYAPADVTGAGDASGADDAVTPTPTATAEVITPPTPGAWWLESSTGSRITLVTQVSSSLLDAGYLNGYHIGHYPVAAADSFGAYTPPANFIEVTPENEILRVSEHFALGQFITKDQFAVWPKYVALDLRLLDKLELVMQELNAMGVRADRMHVMSGFRTPQYNGPGGDGRAALSRHMWGDAADVWVDNDMNGMIDDLNGDGVIDLYDPAVMLRAVERVERRHPELVGGAGTYPATSTHGPYIHIDARGFLARW